VTPYDIEPPDEPSLHDAASPPASHRGAIPLARAAQLPPEMLAKIDVLAEAMGLPVEEMLARCFARGEVTMTDGEVRAAHRSLEARNDTGLFAAQKEP
jgi:hypothetical protein